MLNSKIKAKLEAIIDLPSIPNVLSDVLESVDNLDLNAKFLAKIIEKDQALTAKILKVANSPYYGFSRTISTVDLAILVLGLNSIKEIVLSMILKKFFTKVDNKLFDINNFWKYSIYCAAASKYLSKKFDYRLSGEAFVAGLMHDIGILILIQFFKDDFKKIIEFKNRNGTSWVDAENNVINCTHCEIGAWLAEKWQLPENLCNSILNHHNEFHYFEPLINKQAIPEPLTVMVSLAEWFSEKVNLKTWANENITSPLFFRDEMINLITENTILSYDASIEKLKKELDIQFEKALESHNLL